MEEYLTIFNSYKHLIYVCSFLLRAKKSSKCMNLLFCKHANKSLSLILCSPLIIATRRSNTLWIRKCILGWILIRYCFDFTKYLKCLDLQSSVQVNLCQKLLFLPQLTHNMTTDCSLNYEFSTWKCQAQNMSRTCSVHKLFFVFVLTIQNNSCTQHVLS